MRTAGRSGAPEGRGQNTETTTKRAAPRRLAAWGCASAILLGGGLASAADPVPAPASPPAAATGRPAGTVRLNVRSYRPKETVRLQVGDAQGRYVPVCTAPCSADVVPGTALQVMYGDGEVGHEFTMAGTPGNEMDIEVRPASKGPLAGGIVMASVGGLTATIGLLLVAAGSGSDRTFDDIQTAGWVTTLAGAGIAVAGIVMIATRSKEPRVKEDEHAPNARPIADGAPAWPARAAPVITAYTRTADLYTGDVTTRATSPLGPLPRPAFTPLGFSVHF